MKIPTPKKLPSGTWQIYLRLGGKGISVTAQTKRECINQAQSIKAQYKIGALDPVTMTTKTKPTLGDVVDAYISAHSAVLSPSTIRGYRGNRRNQFQSSMDRPLDEIDYQTMINAELQYVGPKTIHNAWGLVCAALRWSEQAVPTVKLPTVPVREIPFLQPEEIAPFLAAIEGTETELPILIMLHGLRQSEMLALTWDCIDMKGKTMTVQGAMVRDERGGYVRKETNKNKSSSRTVPIMIPRLVDVLKDTPRLTRTVCTVPPETLLRHVKSACKRAGVTVVGNHGLRHSFASLCRYLGIPEEQTMAWGGWSDFATMHKRYIRIAQSAAKRDANKMTDFFKKAEKSHIKRI